jgi:hypothetical protein
LFGKYINQVNVDAIPPQYVVPDETLTINENVENLDVTKVKWLTVKTLEVISGVAREYIAKGDIAAGDFVEFSVNYGYGEIRKETINNIKIYKVDNEKAIISYITSNGQGEIIALQITQKGVLLSEPLPYGEPNAYRRSIAILNSNLLVCLWAREDSTGGNKHRVFTEVF